MKNDDVYSVVRSNDDLKLLGIPDFAKALPKQAVKIKALCGKGITRKYQIVQLSNSLHDCNQLIFVQTWESDVLYG